MLAELQHSSLCSARNKLQFNFTALSGHGWQLFPKAWVSATGLCPRLPLLLLTQEEACSAQTPPLVQLACALLCPIHHPTCQHGSAHPAPWGLWSCTAEGSKQKFQDGAERNEIANHCSFYRKRSETSFSTVLEKIKWGIQYMVRSRPSMIPHLWLIWWQQNLALSPPTINRDSLMPF